MTKEVKKMLGILLLVLMAVIFMNAVPLTTHADTTPGTDGSGSIVIGDPESEENSYELPVSSFNEYSLTQQIYLAGEIGAARTIGSLNFYWAEGNTGTREVEIYLLHTDKEAFDGANDFVPMTEGDLVYDGRLSITGYEIVTVMLDRLFSYDGTNNLLLCVRDKTGEYFQSQSLFRTTSTEGRNSAICIYSDKTEYSAYNPPIDDDDDDGTLLTCRNTLGIPAFVETAGVTVFPEAYESGVDVVRAITAQVEPEDATNKRLFWSVVQEGEVVELYEDAACTIPVGEKAIPVSKVYAKSVGVGSATVTATSYVSSDLHASCDITVNPIFINPDSFQLGTGRVRPLTAVLTPEDQTVIWSVEQDGAVVELYEDRACTIPVSGEATALRTVYAKGGALGTATVTVTSSSDPELFATSQATVTKVRYATVTLTAGDVWEDGSGYQMLLDEDADTFGRIIPSSGPLTKSGDASPEVYDEFEYKIPEDADGSCTTEHVVINDSVIIQIPAGIYDYCFTNPSPEPKNKIWIAGVHGNALSRADDYEFVAGHNYTFTARLFGINDGIDLKDSPFVEEPVAKKLTNTGEAQELVVAGRAFGGTLVYALGTDEQTPPTENLFSETIPTGTDTGTYYVWYQALGDAEHNDSMQECLTVTISDEVDAAARIVGHSLVLSGTIGVRFYVEFSEEDLVDADSCQMTFQLYKEDGEQTVPFAESEKVQMDGKDYYVFTCYVNSVQMADSIAANLQYTLKDADGQGGEAEETVTETYSVRQYIRKFKEDEDRYNAATRELVEALADYGHYAQLYLSNARGWTLGTEEEDPDHVAMDDYGYATTEYVAADKDEAKNGVAGKAVSVTRSSRIEKVTYSLSLASDTSISLYFTPVSGYKGSASATVDGQAVAVTKTGGRFKVVIPSIPAPELGNMHTVRLTTGGKVTTVKISALSYANAILSSSKEATEINAMIALYRYYAAATEAF